QARSVVKLGLYAVRFFLDLGHDAAEDVLADRQRHRRVQAVGRKNMQADEMRIESSRQLHASAQQLLGPPIMIEVHQNCFVSHRESSRYWRSRVSNAV